MAKELDGFIIVADNLSHIEEGLFHGIDTLSIQLCSGLKPVYRLARLNNN